MTLSGAVFPDALRGVEALLDGVEVELPEGAQVNTYLLRPVLFMTTDPFAASADGSVVVHVQRDAVTTGAYDRVEEVRFTVYGPHLLTSTDIAETVLALICGDGIESPETEHSAAFYFDRIEQRIGPTPLDYPNTSVFPVVTSVAVRARPMN